MYGVPYATLHDNCKNETLKNEPGQNPVFSEEEEKDLCDWIIAMSRRGCPIDFDQLSTCVRYFLIPVNRKIPLKMENQGGLGMKVFGLETPLFAQG